MIKINKKSEMSTSFVVSLVLIIIGFAILVIFLLLNFLNQENLDRETCHESVIFRATAGTVTEAAQNFVPLKCKTAKYCITTRLLTKGNCIEFKGEEKEVTKVKVSTKEDIERFLSQEIIDCWSMMGEGKVGLFSQYIVKNYGLSLGSSKVYPTCVICSRIAFDKESLKSSGIDLNEVNIQLYMLSHKVPGKDISYTEYLNDGKAKISTKSTITATDKEVDSQLKNMGLKKPEEEKDEGNQMAVFFMQISSPKHGDTFSNTITAITGISVGSFILAPVTTATKIFKLATNWQTWVALAVVGAYQQGTVAYNRALTAGYCGDVAFGEEARDGCSVIRTTDYRFDEISKYCAVIESIP